MVLVLRLVSVVVRKSKIKESGFKSPLKSNNAVITAHAGLIIVFTVLSILTFNVKATDGVDSPIVFLKWSSAWTFVGGISELLISCNLWIVTDKNQSPVAFRQANKLY